MKIFVCLLLTLCSAYGAAKPNIIIILSDDAGFADFGFQGCAEYPTPHIDSIAKNGVTFTNG